jgi:hypothetical protein
MNAVALYIAKMESCKSASQQFQVMRRKLWSVFQANHFRIGLVRPSIIPKS